MKSSICIDKAKYLEARVVQDAVASVYEAYKKEIPPLLYTDLASFVKHHRTHLRYSCTPFDADVCVALFAGASILPALKNAVADIECPDSLIDLLTTLHSRVKKNIYTSFFQKMRHWISACSSSFFGHFFLKFFFPYDPRCFSKNIGGILLQENIDEKSLTWLVGPTPTYGNHVSKEVVGVIQALSSQTSCFPYKKWIYCNLQSIGHLSEKRRSAALFDFSKKNPSLFALASISVDNPMYVYKEKISSSLQDHKLFVSEQLLHAVFGEKSWYAFALNEEDQREFAQKILTVVDEAAAFCTPFLDRSIAIFHELVVVGLIRFWQGFCLKGVSSAITTVACKECIDRAGSVHATFAWIFCSLPMEERKRLIQAILWGRPLLAKNRLNQQRRTAGFLALVQHASPEDVKIFTEKCFVVGYGQKIERYQYWY